MDCKPIKPTEHGLVDYLFSAVQLGMPKALKLGQETITTYRALGAGFLAVNSLTDTPVGVMPLLSFKAHEKADIGFLAGLSLLTFYKPIRTRKKALAFHLGFLTIAVTNYFLTDYDSKTKGAPERVSRRRPGN